MTGFGEILERLAAAIEARRGADPAASWSARLINDPKLAAKKLADEAIETALAAVQGDRAGIVAESADLLYHLLALLAATGVSLNEVSAALAAREGQSGVAEKASRGA